MRAGYLKINIGYNLYVIYGVPGIGKLSCSNVDVIVGVSGIVKLSCSNVNVIVGFPSLGKLAYSNVNGIETGVPGIGKLTLML